MTYSNSVTINQVLWQWLSHACTDMTYKHQVTLYKNGSTALLKGPDTLFTAKQCGKNPVAHKSTTADFSLYHGKFIYRVEE